MMKSLIVTADDFGQSEAINAGVVLSHKRGIVTSASLMVHSLAAMQAAQMAQDCPDLAVGLHFDLGEWSFHDGEWRSVYTIIADAEDENAVAAEVHSQILAFRRLMGRGPTHIDSHQHVHRTQPCKTLLQNAARRLGIPLRGDGDISYRGDFYGQTAKGEPMHDAITVEALIDCIVSLLPGTTEIGCHPGLDDPKLPSMYGSERAAEVRTLCDPLVRAALDSNAVALRSFAQV